MTNSTANKRVVAETVAPATATNMMDQEEQEQIDLKENVKIGNRKATAKRKKSETSAITADPVNRPRRKRTRCTKKAKASMYVGYVEDGETVEMIMKKFEKLEEFKASKTKSTSEGTGQEADATSSDGKEGMDEKDLEELFNQTSNFDLDNARNNGLQTYNFDQAAEVDDEGFDMTGITTRETGEGITYIVGDEDEEDMWDDLFGTSKKKKAKKSKRSVVGGIRQPKGSSGTTQIAFVSDMHGRYVTALKKIRRVDPNAIVYTKVPKKLPLSWAKIIKPFAPPEAIHTTTNWRPGKIVCLETQQTLTAEIPKESELIKVTDVLETNLSELASKKTDGFQGIVLSPPWKERFPSLNKSDINEKGIEPKDLLKLNLGDSKIISAGFVYIWAPKHWLHDILNVMEEMNFFYVENAINVRQAISNKITGKPGTYFRSSKETLLILRRGTRNKRNGKVEWSRVEIRHQRTSDVNFAYVSNDENGDESFAHGYIHNMVETMLPHGRFNPLPAEEAAPVESESPQKDEAAWLSKEKQRVQQGRVLHLWAPNKARRTGWVSVTC